MARQPTNTCRPNTHLPFQQPTYSKPTINTRRSLESCLMGRKASYLLEQEAVQADGDENESGLAPKAVRCRYSRHAQVIPVVGFARAERGSPAMVPPRYPCSLSTFSSAFSGVETEDVGPRWDIAAISEPTDGIVAPRIRKNASRTAQEVEVRRLLAPDQ
eukprot:857892-Rhodomonas_salina.1